MELSFSLMPHIHHFILIPSRWSATSYSFVMNHVLLPCSILLRTQLLYNLPLTVNDTSLLVSNDTKCLNLFHRIQILVSTAASAFPSTLNMSKKNLSTNSRFALTSHQYLHLDVPHWLLDSRNLYKQMTSSLCTCYPLYHYISCATTSDN